MHIRDILRERKQVLLETIRVAQDELDEVVRALSAIGIAEDDIQLGDAADATIVRRTEHATIRHKMPVNDAIVLAVEAGNKTPMDILYYLKNELNVQTTINSVRSRVSPLKKDGRIAHDGEGWIPASKGNVAGANENDGDEPPSLSFD